ncbi:hypothetical protein [Rhizobium sp. LEGMi135b]
MAAPSLSDQGERLVRAAMSDESSPLAVAISILRETVARDRERRRLVQENKRRPTFMIESLSQGGRSLDIPGGFSDMDAAGHLPTLAVPYAHAFVPTVFTAGVSSR